MESSKEDATELGDVKMLQEQVNRLDSMVRDLQDQALLPEPVVRSMSQIAERVERIEMLLFALPAPDFHRIDNVIKELLEKQQRDTAETDQPQTRYSQETPCGSTPQALPTEASDDSDDDVLAMADHWNERRRFKQIASQILPPPERELASHVEGDSFQVAEGPAWLRDSAGTEVAEEPRSNLGDADKAYMMAWLKDAADMADMEAAEEARSSHVDVDSSQPKEVSIPDAAGQAVDDALGLAGEAASEPVEEDASSTMKPGKSQVDGSPEKKKKKKKKVVKSVFDVLQNQEELGHGLDAGLEAKGIDHSEVLAFLRQQKTPPAASAIQEPAKKEQFRQEQHLVFDVETWEIHAGGFLKEVWPTMQVREIGKADSVPPGSKCRGETVRCRNLRNGWVQLVDEAGYMHIGNDMRKCT